MKALMLDCGILFEANSEGEACDLVSGMLSERGQHELNLVVDWSYVYDRTKKTSGPIHIADPDRWFAVLRIIVNNKDGDSVVRLHKLILEGTKHAPQHLDILSLVEIDSDYQEGDAFPRPLAGLNPTR